MPSRKRKYWFVHRDRYVFMIAGSVGDAKQKFENRYGYTPVDPLRSEEVE